MAFDNTNPAHLQELNTEVTTDPIGMGYDVAGSARRVAILLNDPTRNVGEEFTEREFTGEALMDALVPTDFEAAATKPEAAAYTQMLLQHTTNGSSILNYKPRWRDLFPPTSQTVTNLDGQTQRLSRADVIWGEGSVITENDLALAREAA